MGAANGFFGRQENLFLISSVAASDFSTYLIPGGFSLLVNVVLKSHHLVKCDSYDFYLIAEMFR